MLFSFFFSFVSLYFKSTCCFLLNSFNLSASHHASTTDCDVCSQVADLQPVYSLLTFSALLPPLPPQGTNNPGNKQWCRKGTGWLHLWLHTEQLVWLAGPATSDKMQCESSFRTKLLMFHGASPPAHCLCRRFLLCSCYHVNRMNRKSDTLLQPANSWPHSDLLTSQTLTDCGVNVLQFCAAPFILNFHTFRLKSLNAHLPLWTFLSSKHRNNPISLSSCDAWMWGVQDSQLVGSCQPFGRESVSQTLHVASVSRTRSPSEERRPSMHPSELHRNTNWTADMMIVPLLLFPAQCHSCLCGDFFHTDLVPSVQYHYCTHNT